MCPIIADVLHMVSSDQFVEVFVNTPISVCEDRDAKGMYAMARRGEITGFTGIDDPYEPPETPEIEVFTETQTAEENARRILDYLRARGFVRGSESPSQAPMTRFRERWKPVGISLTEPANDRG